MSIGIPINLAAKLAEIQAPWTPHVCAELNDYEFKLARLEGDFVWHAHAGTDEAFLVIEGQLMIELRGEASGPRSVALGPGDLFVVPQGIEHWPRSADGCGVLLIEPRGVINTGDAGGGMTVEPTREACDSDGREP